MSTTTYMPRADSLADKVCRFFMRLPDEELMSREIAEKWGLETKNVGNHLARAVEAEYLAMDGTIYSAGPGIALFKAALAHQLPPAEGAPIEEVGDGEPRPTGFHGWLERRGEPSAEGRPARRATAPAAPATPPPTKKRNGPFWIDPKTVQIDKGVPMAGRSAAMDWTPLLDAMEVGDSFLLPPAAKSAISAAMKAYKDTTGKALAKRTVDGGVRVWRVE